MTGIFKPISWAYLFLVFVDGFGADFLLLPPASGFLLTSQPSEDGRLARRKKIVLGAKISSIELELVINILFLLDLTPPFK